jgi:hypothetical protein
MPMGRAIAAIIAIAMMIESVFFMSFFPFKGFMGKCILSRFF